MSKTSLEHELWCSQLWNYERKNAPLFPNFSGNRGLPINGDIPSGFSFKASGNVNAQDQEINSTRSMGALTPPSYFGHAWEPLDPAREKRIELRYNKRLYGWLL